MKLIVGLGNPGRGYAENRHNIGFMCLRHFARTHGIRLDKKQGNARTGSGEVSGSRVTLARPQTFMNSSGEAVSKLVKKLKITPDNLIVIHDDLDLPLGKIRIRHGGSSGGHKGINSIIAHLVTSDFTRIRIGIGRPDDEDSSGSDRETEVIDYVLSDFTSGEKVTISPVIPEVSQAVLCLLTEGLAPAMNRYN
ncbi:aminoacyl-tRNA hydrolase [Chloroflexota bacterium]